MYETRSRSNENATGLAVSLWNVLLAVGFLALAVAVLAAYDAPAAGGELSIYAATPAAFWAGFALAGLISLGVALSASSALAERLALLLGGLGAVAFVGLPLIRGYHFYGAGDPLTHLGWLRMLDSGSLSPFGLLYPGVHTVSLFVETTFGLPDTHAMQLAVVAYMVVYFVSVPLCVRAIANGRKALVFGSFAGFALLSVNNVGIFPMAFPTLQAFTLVPAVLYLAMRFLARPSDESGSGYLSAESLVLAVAAGSLVLVHPQQALNLATVFVAIALLQTVVRRLGSGGWSDAHRSFHGQALVLLAVFGVWSWSHERVGIVVDALRSNLLGAAAPGAEAAQRATSLDALGGDIVALMAKLFGVPILFALLAGLFVLTMLRASATGRSLDRTGAVRYLGIGIVPILIAFLVFYLAALTLQPFRYLGFALVIVTVLGAVALSDVVAPRVASLGTVAKTVGVVLLAVCLAAQLAAVHPSPYMYKSSGGVAEAEMTGYETAFEQRHPDAAFTGVRSGPSRYVDAVYGPYSATAMTFPGKRESIEPTEWESGVAGLYPDDRYLPVTENGRMRELVLYDELRYSRDGFRRLGTSTAVDRVQSNGEFTLYFLPGDA